MGFIWVKQDQVARSYQIPLCTAGDRQPAIQDPDQFPFRVDMERTIIYSIKKDAQPLNLPMIYNLKFIHHTTSGLSLMTYLFTQYNRE